MPSTGLSNELDDCDSKRIFVVYFLEGYIGVAPTILGLVRELTAVGHHVHVCCQATEFPSAGDLPASCRVTILSRLQDYWLPARLFSCLRRIKLSTLVPLLELGWCFFQSFLLEMRIRSEQPDLSRVHIGVDSRGGILAWSQSALWQTNHVYLSLELVPPRAYRWLAKAVYWLEGFALKRASAIVIQDADRLRTLHRYHPPSQSRTYFLPNSAGAVPRRALHHSSDNYLRSKLVIDSKKFPHVALQAGMIQDETYAQELAKVFGQIDDGFALVLHDRIKRSSSEPYMQSLRNSNSRNLFLSLDPVPFDQLDAVFSAATVGIVFYRPVDENFAQIAMASGKLPLNLKHGIPVVMNALPSLEALNERYQFGVIVQDPGNAVEMSAALSTIMAKYDFYSSNARRCFEAEFDFHAKFKPIRAFLESL